MNSFIDFILIFHTCIKFKSINIPIMINVQLVTINQIWKIKKKEKKFNSHCVFSDILSFFYVWYRSSSLIVNCQEDIQLSIRATLLITVVSNSPVTPTSITYRRIMESLHKRSIPKGNLFPPSIFTTIIVSIRPIGAFFVRVYDCITMLLCVWEERLIDWEVTWVVRGCEIVHLGS